MSDRVEIKTFRDLSAYETENWLLKLTDSQILRRRINMESLKEISALNTEVMKMLATRSSSSGAVPGLLSFCTVKAYETSCVIDA